MFHSDLNYMSQRTLEPGGKDPQVENKRKKKKKDRERYFCGKILTILIILLSKQKSGDMFQVIKQPTLHMDI